MPPADVGPGAVLTLLTKVAFFFGSWGDGPGLLTLGRGDCAAAGGFADGAVGLTACGVAGWGLAGWFGFCWPSIQAFAFGLRGDCGGGCTLFS